MDNGTNSGGADDGDFDDSDITHVEDATGEIIARMGRLLCEVAIDVGRYGNSLGGLSADVDGDGSPRESAERLTRAHAIGCNAVRSLRDLVEHGAAVNEVLNKAATRARARTRAAAKRP